MLELQAFIPKIQARGFIVPNFIQTHEHLSLGAKYLYGVLCDYARDKSFCYPSKKTLAKHTNASLNSIRNWLKELVSYGFIKAVFNGVKDIFYLFSPQSSKVSTNNKNNDNAPNERADANTNGETKPSIDENNAQVANDIKHKAENRSNLFLGQGGANFEQEGANFEPKTNLKETSLKPPLPPQQEKTSTNTHSQKSQGGDYKFVNANFEEIWNAYPKKEAKELARILWFRLAKQNKLPSNEILKKSIQFFENSFQWQKKSGQFVPLMVNFLRGLRWKEFLENEKKEQSMTNNNPNNAHNANPIGFETMEMLEERVKREKAECVRHQEEITKIRTEWEKFAAFFLDDTSFKRVVAEICFFENFNKNNELFQVNTFHNMTAYAYFASKNLLNSSEVNITNDA